MSLDVIGAGLPRTGTLSLKFALERLGFSPCLHSFDLSGQDDRWDGLRRAALGEAIDWDTVFGGCRATTDTPACNFYLELARFYPKAKVILGTREKSAWLASVNQTIEKVRPPTAARASRLARIASMALRYRCDALRQAGFDVEYRWNTLYDAHHADVIANIPPERLLIFNVAEGWGPLCEFLGCPVPDEPFPRENARETFGERYLLQWSFERHLDARDIASLLEIDQAGPIASRQPELVSELRTLVAAGVEPQAAVAQDFAARWDEDWLSAPRGDEVLADKMWLIWCEAAVRSNNRHVVPVVEAELKFLEAAREASA